MATRKDSTEIPEAEISQAFHEGVKSIKQLAAEQEKVSVALPFVKGVMEDDVPITINGYTLVIKRGEPVQVPRMFYEVLHNAGMA